MTEGIIRVGDVILNPKVIQEVSRTLSIERSIVEKAGIPTTIVNTIDFKKSFRVGGEGEINNTLNGAPDARKLTKKNGEVRIVFPGYTFMIDEQTKAVARSLRDEVDANTENITQFFRSIRNYYGLSVYKAGAMLSAAASEVWTSKTAKIEEDIVKGITCFLTYTDYEMKVDKISVVVPAAAMSGALKLDMIGNIQQRISDYLGGTYNLEFFAYTPRTIKGSSSYDALGNDAIMFIQGIRTGRIFEYLPPAGRDIKMYEYERIAATADRYIHKIGVQGFIEWDGQATHTSSTSYKTYRVYKITGVKS